MLTKKEQLDILFLGEQLSENFKYEDNRKIVLNFIYGGVNIMIVNVKEFLGQDFTIEDAIILRAYIQNNLNENIELDFDGVQKVSTTFLNCLFTDLINKEGRDYIIKKICVKNLSNQRNFSRVVRGTAFN